MNRMNRMIESRDYLASLSPQRGEGLEGEGWCLLTDCLFSARQSVLTPHPGPLPVEGRGGMSSANRNDASARLGFIRIVAPATSRHARKHDVKVLGNQCITCV